MLTAESHRTSPDPAADPSSGHHESTLVLPPTPTDLLHTSVAAWSEPVVIDTYLPTEPDRYPAFLQSRVYQGSSGRVYPLPFHDRISPTKAPHRWQAIHLENQWVRLMVLPELGGRIHVGLDKSNGYDFFYRNNVIKPALVGLAGPWISGGVEFNWPQHHRPATFLPTDTEIEREPDGSITVWCSDHDPMSRMKGMHGIRLRPDSSAIELRVRLYNRSEQTQTFLWWANVAAAVHDDYQSFFPTDVQFVADHAKRAMTTFPQAEGKYYGVDYAERASQDEIDQGDQRTPGKDRLDWYRNIPVPTSYMCLGSQDSFFGGYDHRRQAGFVHWADRDVSPGKKQWTWGNADFGWAWDANLTDGDGPYVELMAGVYTDNQPDFSFLTPGETKTFSQFWFPIQQIGPVHQANPSAAVRLDVESTQESPGTVVTIGVATTSSRVGAQVTLRDTSGAEIYCETVDLAPDQPYRRRLELAAQYEMTDVILTVHHADAELISWQHRSATVSSDVPQPATEPASPPDIPSVDELYLTGLHLQQYRHATRQPEPYWEEALRRDPGDYRCNTALGARLHRSGLYEQAATKFRTAVARQTVRNPNPSDGEPSYRLGVTLLHLQRPDEAREALAKATWNAAWRAPAHYALARLSAQNADWNQSLNHTRSALEAEPQHSQAGNLQVLVLRRLGRTTEAQELLAGVRAVDPLDMWARHLDDAELTKDAQTLLDLSLDYAACGFTETALDVLNLAIEAAKSQPLGQTGVAPLLHYHRAVLLEQRGDLATAAAARTAASQADRTHCLASRLEDFDALTAAVAVDPADGCAHALLGSWFYDQRQFQRAIQSWSAAAQVDPQDPVVLRNLGLAEFNVNHDHTAAVQRYRQALTSEPADAKLLFEFDQLSAALQEPPADRLARLQGAPDLVLSRDDLLISYVTLLTIDHQSQRARDLMLGRRFQPWEGGEGQVLAAWEEALAELARAELAAGRPDQAVGLLVDALNPPENLGEARHLLANNAHLQLLLGDALAASDEQSRTHAAPTGPAAQAAPSHNPVQPQLAAWNTAAHFVGDFQLMATQPFSEMTLYSILAHRRLGNTDKATELITSLRSYVDQLAGEPAVIDYFATSLPSMLLFQSDPQLHRDRQVALIRAQLAVLSDPGDAEALTAELPPSFHRRFLENSQVLQNSLIAQNTQIVQNSSAVGEFPVSTVGGKDAADGSSSRK